MLLWIATTAVAADHHTWAQDIDHIDLRDAAGDVHVEAGADRIEVKLVPVKGEGCAVEVGDRDGHAFVEIKARAPGAQCQMNVVVRLPDEASAHVKLGAGDVHLVDVGPLELDVGAGTVRGSVRGKAAVQVGAGDVELASLSSPIRAQVGAGTVRLGFDRAPEGRIDVATGLGTIDVDLPDDAPVGLDGTRQRAVALRVDASAPTVIAAHSGLGDVSVH